MHEGNRGLGAAIAGSTVAFALALVGTGPGVRAAEDVPGVSQALPPGCVAHLLDVRTSGYASHYVTSGAYAYGEWRASGYRGQSLWKRAGAAWCKVRTGVAILDRRALVASGLPGAVAGRLLATMHASPELAPPVTHVARRGAGPHRVKR